MHERDARRYAIAALVAVALTFVVVVASAFLRHSQAGLGCTDWPACYARVAIEAQGAGVAFARGAGYRKITLWTQKPLKAARAIYQQAGFRLVHEEAHRSFGQDLVAETWELSLRPEPAS